MMVPSATYADDTGRPGMAGPASANDQPVGRAVGCLHQALFSGVLVKWLIDPDRAPSAADLATALQAIARQLCAQQGTEAAESRPDAKPAPQP